MPNLCPWASRRGGAEARASPSPRLYGERAFLRSEPAGLPPVQQRAHLVRRNQVGDADDGDHDHGCDDELRAGLGAVAEAGAGDAERHVALAMADVERRALAAHAGAHPGLAEVDLDARQDADRLA